VSATNGVHPEPEITPTGNGFRVTFGRELDAEECSKLIDAAEAIEGVVRAYSPTYRFMVVVTDPAANQDIIANHLQVMLDAPGSPFRS
jgi:hypothetical protein